MPSISEFTLFQPRHVLITQWSPAGFTKSGLYLEHDDKLPKVFGRIVQRGREVDEVSPNDMVVFPRYAGESVELDEGTFHVMHICDVQAIIEDFDEGVYEGAAQH